MFGLKMPQSAFVHADGFLRAGTPQSDPPNPYDSWALVANNAMAAELYLKCLIHIETGRLVKNQHNLQKLFGMLPRETQAEIQKRFDAAMRPPNYDFSSVPEAEREALRKVAERMPKNLVEALRKGGDAFVEWRYLYENESDTGNPYSLFNLPAILRVVILEHKPEWARFGVRMKKVGGVLP